MNVAVPLKASMYVDQRVPIEERGPQEISLPPSQDIYGGVQMDYSLLGSISGGGWSRSMILLPMLVLDLPLSAVGDTVTLPLTLAKLLRERDRIESTPATTP